MVNPTMFSSIKRTDDKHVNKQVDKHVNKQLSPKSSTSKLLMKSKIRLMVSWIALHSPWGYNHMTHRGIMWQSHDLLQYMILQYTSYQLEGIRFDSHTVHFACNTVYTHCPGNRGHMTAMWNHVTSHTLTDLSTYTIRKILKSTKIETLSRVSSIVEFTLASVKERGRERERGSEGGKEGDEEGGRDGRREWGEERARERENDKNSYLPEHKATLTVNMECFLLPTQLY